MRDAPAARPLAVEADGGEDVEPARDVVGVPQGAARLDLALPDERLRVDDEPRLAPGAQDVPSVQVLVDEPGGRSVDRAIDVERCLEERALEGCARSGVPARDVLRPAVGLVGDQRERMTDSDRDLQARDQLRDHFGFVAARIPEARSGKAALEEESPVIVGAGDELHRSPTAPLRERVRLVIGLPVRGRIELQHDVSGGHDERVRRVERLVELELPHLRALGDERGERSEPLALVAPGLGERRGDPHRGSVRPDRRISCVESRFLERALELAENGRATTHPNPIVGAVIVAGEEVVGEGWHERKGGPHAEVVALEAAGERARGGTAYVTLEPCSHHGATPPCADALVAAGVARVVAGQLDPHPEHGGGLERLRAAGVEVEIAEGDLAFRCRQQIEEWRTFVTARRPFVTYKVAVTLDGRVRVPGERWVTGEASRTLVHVLRAQSDAVAVGMGTVRWDNPRLDARDVPVVRQPRRIAFGRGPLPDGSDLELRSGPLRDELEALASDGVQSLLLEGGPTLAAAFLADDLVDKLLVFVAPTLSGEGPGVVEGLPGPLRLSRMEARPIGEDVLLQAYVHEP